MKKKVLITAGILSTLLLAGCSNQNTSSGNHDSKKSSVVSTKPYYVDHYIRSYYKNLVFFKNTRKFISTAYVCGLSGRFEFFKVR